MANRRSFTLLELMICLMILASIAGALSFPIKESLSQARFENSCKKVKQELEKLQILALTYGSDMHVRFVEEKGKKFMISLIDEAALTRLNGLKIPLDHVLKLSWEENHNKETLSKVKQLDFDILSNGRTNPPLLLKFEGKHRTLYLDMCMPLLMRLSSSLPAAKEYPLPPIPNKSEV